VQVQHSPNPFTTQVIDNNAVSKHLMISLLSTPHQECSLVFYLHIQHKMRATVKHNFSVDSNFGRETGLRKVETAAIKALKNDLANFQCASVEFK
jgi:hypothetical protein